MKTAVLPILLLVANIVFAQSKETLAVDTLEKISTITTDVVVISGTRTTDKTPTTVLKVNREDIIENNLGKDLPYLLELTPSVVVSSDGGSGTGYTSMRIRGSDMTRINFTLNGFPMNDAESQGVFLVDLPDLASDIEDLEIQRGIGTSTNGAGAFGASVNINTNKKHEKAYAEFHNSFGSFNTLKNTIRAGTGVIKNHFTVDARFSHLMTDGYIDRANAKMFAYSLNAAYFNKNSTVRFSIFSGKEITHQAWNGVDFDTAKDNPTYNSAGTDYGQKEIPHNNEIDNYNQDNYQLAFSHKFNKNINANIGLHYTKGKGYYEQYKVGASLSGYGIENTSTETDLIRRKWLDNDFYGAIFSVNYSISNLKATLGGAWNQYDGNHFGEIIWAQDAKDVDFTKKYYNNNGLKTDFNTFLKAEYTLWKRMTLFADIQYRRVSCSMSGKDSDQSIIYEDEDFDFVNPKLGLSYLLGMKKNNKLYVSFAMANREPTRNDFIDNKILPKSEQMIDFELGFRHKAKKLNIGINAFYMKYKNQLVLTGALNDVGSPVRRNVDNSFRTGLETDFVYEPLKFFGLNANAAWSINEIEEFSFKDYNGNTITHDKTKISYSPAFVGNISLYTKAFKGFKFTFITKYVSEQFLDNTSNPKKSLAPYLLNDARLSYSIKPKFVETIDFIFKLNNIFSTKYSSNGYVYYDTPYYYPQAGINFEAGININL